MERLFKKKLEEWKSAPNHKPLIVRGARQVGKSWCIKEFGKSSFGGNFHLIDFEKHPDWISVFEKNLDPVRILGELEILLNAKILPGRDLLFFDEIQASPKAIMSLRYLYEDLPELHVIAAGSLLEFGLKDISFPVGRVQILNMYPLNFFEFLLAEGKEQAAEIIKSVPSELPVSIHNMLMESLRQYMFVGGMPECVKVWCETKSLTTAFDVQYSLTETYRQDFSKYAPYVDKRVLNGVLNSVAKNIGHQLKYTQLVEDFSGPTNKKAFDLLLLARVIQKISATSPASLPLGNNASEKRFKSILVDIGMMRTLNNLPANLEFMKNDLLSMYNGALAEHFAGQEFVSSGMDNLHFWSREAKSSSAEVDYLIEKNNMIFPVEIKGGVSGKLKSMHLLLKEYPHISQGFILSSAAYGKIPEQKLTFLPLYFAYSLAINAF